jgi:hypothetical protein
MWVDSAARPFDPPLTAAGVAQGTALGRRLRDFSPPVSKIFVSPLGRTVQTACAAAAELGGADLPLFIEPGLVEVRAASLLLRRGCLAAAPPRARQRRSAAGRVADAPAGAGCGLVPLLEVLAGRHARRGQCRDAADVRGAAAWRLQARGHQLRAHL